MKIHKTRKRILHFSQFLIVFFFVLIGVLDYYLLQGRVYSWLVFSSLQVMMLLVPTFVIWFTIGLKRSYLLFESDYFEYYNGYRARDRIYASTIKGYSFYSGLLKIYFEREKLSGEGKEIAVLTIHRVASFANIKEFISWLEEHYPSYLDGQAWTDIQKLMKNENADFSPEKYEKSMLTAKFVAKALNFGSILFSSLLIFAPVGKIGFAVVLLFYPLISMFTVFFSRGLIHFDKRGNSIFPSIGFSIIISSWTLTWWTLNTYTPLSYKSWAMGAFVVEILYFILFLFIQREFSVHEKYGRIAILTFFLLFSFAGMGTSLMVNCAFDTSDGELVEMWINDENEIHTVKLHSGFVRFKWYKTGVYYDEAFKNTLEKAALPETSSLQDATNRNILNKSSK